MPRSSLALGPVLTIAAAVGHVLLATSAHAAAKGRPNVILIMTDDQGYGDVRSHGNDQIDTPTMDRIAAEGTRFDRFFVSPMCAPTRASLLTGRYNLRCGVSWVSHALETMRLNETTIAEALHDAGYVTGCFGKWHNGAYYPYHPNKRGFDEFFGFCWGAWQNYFDPVLERNGTPIQTQGYITDVLTDAVLAFIENHRNQPFFCYVPYNAPHHPFQIPATYFDKYRQRGFNEKTACVYGMVENIDDNLARILAKLDELALTTNTVLIFTSDNGPWLPRYNGGMRGRKAEVDEGGVRVPLFIRWPGQISAGATVTKIAAHIDLFPTILALCGIPKPKTLPQDGCSLVPLLEGDTADWPDRMLFTHQNRFGETHMTPGAVRTQQYRLVNRGQGYELYDMLADPGQTTDVASHHPTVTQHLATAYEAWYRDVTADGVAAPPAPVGYPGADVVEIHAEDAKLHDGLKFRLQRGWAHDSVVDWHNTDGYVVWNLNVQRTGRYEVALMYSCPATDVGSTVQIEIGSQRRQTRLATAHDPQGPPDQPAGRRRVATSGPVWIKPWAPLTFPPLTLEKGPARLVVRALEIPGTQAMELKAARVRWMD